MLGLCIVVISLLTSVLAGFLMDVEKTQRTTTAYEYVTDVTGLFEIGEAPTYITYNPSSNYVGYAGGKVNYTEASSVNSYRYVKTPGEVTNVSKTYTNASEFPRNNNFPIEEQYLPDPVSVLIHIVAQNMPVDYGDTETWAGLEYNTTSNPAGTRSTTLQSILNDMNLNGITAEINISWGDYPLFIVPHSAWNYTTFVGGNGITYYNYGLSINWATDSITRLKVDITTGSVTAFHNDAQKWTAAASNVDVLYRYSTNHDGSFNAANTTTTFNAAVTSPPVYGYADPSAGVTMANSPATWTNGYDNNEVFVTVAKNGNAYNNLTITAGSSSITTNISNTGNMTINVNGAGGSESKGLGLWTAAQIRLNLGAGTVSVTPIIGAPDYMAPVAENSTTVTFTNWYNGGDLTTLTFSSVGASCRWGITETRVFLNTHNAIMNNPSIDITQHFPDLDGWRLNFYSFATVGESITINNKRFDVGADQSITVSNDRTSITGQLSDVFVSKDLDNNIWFGFRNGQNIDLGPAVSDTISFGGLWYFTTGLYDAYLSTVEFYDWNIDGFWHATGGQIIITFLGCLIGGVVVSKGLLKIPFKGSDGAVVVGAFIFMLIIGGSLI